MRILLTGPPGSGKGTQAAVLAERLALPAISTGDIFRKSVTEETVLGRQAQVYMARGEYVPDEITNAMIAQRLAESDTGAGFILDGYPRTIGQVAFLDSVLVGHRQKLDVVLALVVDAEELTWRLLRRSHTESRQDDTESVIRRRLDVYTDQTRPILMTYKRRGLLLELDGTGEAAQVTERALAALHK